MCGSKGNINFSTPFPNMFNRPNNNSEPNPNPAGAGLLIGGASGNNNNTALLTPAEPIPLFPEAGTSTITPIEVENFQLLTFGQAEVSVANFNAVITIAAIF